MNLNNVKSALNRKDIKELKKKIDSFKNQELDEERFKHFRLTRGVYGQRQLGVQMFRIKIPYGKLKAQQLHKIADLSDQFATGNLHLTTRQNIQFHYVKLDDSPKIWQGLGSVDLNAREACGNTVRTVTASAKAGIDPDEPFDVGPYAKLVTDHFLRNAVGQEMGRKIKMAFSSSDRDTAFAYFHDFGFIPRIRDGKRGFKVLVGGGLGAVPHIAKLYSEFLPEAELLSFLEAGIRIFDRYGERVKRQLARLKYLIQKEGLSWFKEQIREELRHMQAYPVVLPDSIPNVPIISSNGLPKHKVKPSDDYSQWLSTNVITQKQPGYYAVALKVRLGDLSSVQARKLSSVVSRFFADDIRITVNQGILLRYATAENLPKIYEALAALNLADYGFDTILDVTACPGTDTCNLGVSDSTSLATVLEDFIRNKYPQLIHDYYLKIKISGCMNACGQHMAANIGLHGSSINLRKIAKILPAVQIVLGGGVSPDGQGFIADKVIKIPTKRTPSALGIILDDYQLNASADEFFNDYYLRVGKAHFYQLLKHLGQTDNLTEDDFFDWGQETIYQRAIGVGECAGVALDVVGAILTDASERLQKANEEFRNQNYAGSIYQCYSAMVIGAKALLLAREVHCNTHIGIINDFDEHYVKTQEFKSEVSFASLVLQFKHAEGDQAFAAKYQIIAAQTLSRMVKIRQDQLSLAGAEKEVISNYYNA